jgi:hypothetical protein
MRTARPRRYRCRGLCQNWASARRPHPLSDLDLPACSGAPGDFGSAFASTSAEIQVVGKDEVGGTR